MKIIEITEMSQQVYDAFSVLIPQLSTSAVIPSWEALEDMIHSKASIVLAAVDSENNQKILGSLTLVVFRIPTGIRAWIEDVIVDEKGHIVFFAQVVELKRLLQEGFLVQLLFPQLNTGHAALQGALHLLIEGLIAHPGTVGDGVEPHIFFSALHTWHPLPAEPESYDKWHQ